MSSDEARPEALIYRVVNQLVIRGEDLREHGEATIKIKARGAVVAAAPAVLVNAVLTWIDAPETVTQAIPIVIAFVGLIAIMHSLDKRMAELETSEKGGNGDS